MFLESDNINGLVVVNPTVFYDCRGEFVSTYNTYSYKFKDRGNDVVFVEDDISISYNGVLKGLHGDDSTCKLFHCVHGWVCMAVVDLRKHSTTYGHCELITLSDKNHTQVFVPSGCANGHLCLSDKSVLLYKQSDRYDGGSNQVTLAWDDPTANIKWPCTPRIISERDRNGKTLGQCSF
jgi:dTDP-4-dehydrorhamnose 3,5-epimerase